LKVITYHPDPHTTDCCSSRITKVAGKNSQTNTYEAFTDTLQAHTVPSHWIHCHNGYALKTLAAKSMITAIKFITIRKQG